MNKLFITFILLIVNIICYSQVDETDSYKTEEVFRLNFLNPGVEYEMPTGTYSTFSAGLGVGYGGSYPDLSDKESSGLIYMIAPFLDLQHKWYYNLEKRLSKNKSISNNSGNFISARFLTRGHSIADNLDRTSNFDFAVMPTWGLQRSYNDKFHLLFDIGSLYYFDSKGNGNFFPIMFQINLGFDF